MDPQYDHFSMLLAIKRQQLVADIASPQGEGSAEELQGELRNVRDALMRITDGVFGICIVCGKTIERERLEAYPTAQTCIGDKNIY